RLTITSIHYMIYSHGWGYTQNFSPRDAPRSGPPHNPHRLHSGWEFQKTLLFSIFLYPSLLFSSTSFSFLQPRFRQLSMFINVLPLARQGFERVGRLGRLARPAMPASAEKASEPGSRLEKST